MRTVCVMLLGGLLAGCATWSALQEAGPPGPATVGVGYSTRPAPPPSAALLPPAPAGVPAVTARITHVDPHHGFIVVQWDEARSTIMMDKREIGAYRVGDEIVLDGALRPLGPPR